VLPAALGASSCLVAEAIGQLGAWVAVAHSEFRERPIPALIGRVEVPSALTQGDKLELEVAVEWVDRGPRGAILMNGRAVARGRRVLELSDCLSPLFALDEFDDPERVRSGFALLCEPCVATPRAFDWATAAADPMLDLAPQLVAVEGGPPARLRAEILLPTRSVLFDDHFPRKPVLPASLLLDRLARLAVSLAGPAQGADVPRAACLGSVKLRAFVAPGARLELVVSARPGGLAPRLFDTRATLAGRPVASAAIEVEPGGVA
jgi:3-hydroxymyristoyl/3-hydroxydecanoyl-(acyl carrier protein) dehydratase